MTAPELPDDPAVLKAREAILEKARDWPFFKLIGMEIVDMRPGWSMLKIQYRPDLTQPAMIMHGGIIATLIDTGIAHAILLTNVHLHDGNAAIVSIDLRVKFFRPVSEGTLYCESTVTRSGRQIIHAESIVRSEDGKEVARGDSIYMVVTRDKLKKE
ncbi:MAG TPA: PaaI family thioesterase [Pirellulales bacterium]|jgi:acyl-CoA thioesterase